MNEGVYISSLPGNGGPGIFTGLSPGAADDIASIGCADSSDTPIYTWQGSWTVGDETGAIRYQPGSPFNFPPDNKLTVWTDDTVDTFNCQEATAALKATLPKDLSNVIWLGQFDQCWKGPDDTPLTVPQALGIPYVLYYTWENYTVTDGGLVWEGTSDLKGVGMVDFATASLLRQAKEKHGSLTVSLAHDISVSDEQVSFEINNRTGLLTSFFSGWGPTLRGGSMPTLLAPGANILSTFPPNMGGYGAVSGQFNTWFP